MSKHMPERWIDMVDDDGWLLVHDGSNTICGFGDMEDTTPEDHANARLIAASPDLLAALTDAQIAIGEMDESWLGYEPMLGYPYKSELMDKIKAAIAKATV